MMIVNKLLSFLLLSIFVILAFNELTSVNGQTRHGKKYGSPNPKVGSKASEGLSQLANEFQVMGVEGLGNTNPEYWERTVEVIKDFPAQVTMKLRTVPHSFKNILLNRWSKDKKEFKKRATESYQMASNVINGASSLVKEFSENLYNHIEQFEKNELLNAADPDHHSKWHDAKGRIVKNVENIQKQINNDVEEYYHHYQDFIDGVSLRVNLHHHHPVIQCGKCDAEFSLRKFLQLVEDRGYFIKEEDWWTDEELEEFYSGWAVWANRSATHCPYCGAVSWNDIRFVSDEEEIEIESRENDNSTETVTSTPTTTTTTSTDDKTTTTPTPTQTTNKTHERDEL